MSRRNKKAAKKFFRKLLGKQGYVPRALVTDKLKSYSAAKQAVLPRVEHRSKKRDNHRAENSHQPTRERERTMRRFTSPRQAQRFLSVHGVVYSFLRPGRHQVQAYRTSTRLNHFALKGKRYQAALARAFDRLQQFKAARPAATTIG